MFREEKQQVKGTKVRVTDVCRNTTIIGIFNAQPWVGNVQNAIRKTTLQKYVRRSESTVSTLVTLTSGHQDGASGRSSDRLANEYARVGRLGSLRQSHR